MGPVLPFLSDSPDLLDRTVRQIAAAGAASVSPIMPHLRPGAREWFMAWLAASYPDLVGRYQRLYAAGSYAPREYRQRIAATVTDLARRHGVGHASPGRARALPSPTSPSRGCAGPGHAAGVQLRLL